MSAYRGPDGQEDMPYLLTPGPVTTSRNVKFAMLADFGPQDPEFRVQLNVIRRSLLQLAHAQETHACILLDAQPDLAMQAVVASFLPQRRKKTLVISNGADGEAAARVLERHGQPILRLSYRESTQPRAADVAKELEADKSISHVWLTHCESASGMLNPLAEIAACVHQQGRILVLDATSTFGGIDVDVADLHVGVLLTASQCCLESVPGLSVVMAERSLLQLPAEAPSHPGLDLHGQFAAQHEDSTSQPLRNTHAAVALREALRELKTEGGIEARSKRYRRSADSLRERLKALGFQLFLPYHEASDIVTCVLAPRAATFDFERFAEHLRSQGFAIAQGALASRPSFRIACAGQVDEQLILKFVEALETTMNTMEVSSLAPVDA